MRDLCCVSIALWEGTNPIFGVIYRFDTDEIFTGKIGEGARCNGITIHTSSVDNLGHAFLTTGFPIKNDLSDTSMNDFVRCARSFKKVRMFGTAALMGTLVASGKADVYYENKIMVWDVAASIAIVLSAGGCMDLSIESDNECVCKLFANEKIMEEFNDKIVRVLRISS